MSEFSNNQRVNQGLLILATALRPYVEAEMENVYGAGWRARASIASGSDPNAPLDAYGLFKTMMDQWQSVFRLKLKPSDRTNVSQAFAARNAVAHASGEIGPADAITYLNAFQAVAKAVGAKQALSGLQALLDDQLKALGGKPADQAKPPAPTQSSLALGDSVSKLPSWRDVAPPHPDVMSARFAEAEFAADLATVASHEANETYQDPQQFFRVTYPTEGLRAVLQGAIARLAGEGGEPVVGLQTAFGGGKTHTLLALYHLASAPDPHLLPCVGELIKSAGIDRLKIGAAPIVFVGTSKGPDVPMLVEGGRTVRTLWGLMAYRLAGWDGLEKVKTADEERTNPGSEVLIELLRKGAPCLILLDEVVAFARQLDGTYYESFLTFFQSLTEAAKAVPGVLVVGSLPESDTEVGGERGAEALRRLEKIFGRIQTTWAPATGIETYEIIRRRLFQELGEEGEATRDRVVKAYLAYYRKHGGDFPSTVKDKSFEESMRAAYPVHPELFAIFQERWTHLDKFQRTRGVLKLMAQIIFRLWRDGHPGPMIMAGDLPLADDKVRAAIIDPLERAYDTVMTAEVAGDTARPAVIEARSGNLGQARAVTRAATATFMATAPFGANQSGYEIAKIRLACAIPEEQPALFGEGLRRLQETSAFLYHDGDRYWFSTQPTLNQLADDRARAQSTAAIENEIVRLLREEERHRGATFPRVHAAPDDPFGIEDAHDVALVILSPSDTHVARPDSETPAQAKAAAILERRGASQRIYRNRLLFLAPDQSAIEDVEKAVRRKLAWASIVGDAEGTLQLTPNQRQDAENRAKDAASAAERALRTTWRHMIAPAEPFDEKDKARGFALETITLANRTGDPLARVAWKKAIDDGTVVQSLGRAALELDLKKVWPEQHPHVEAIQLRDWFAQYTYLHRLLGPATLAQSLTEAAGVLGAPFGVAQSFDETSGRYSGLTLDRPVLVTLEGGTLLVARSAAEKQLVAETTTKPRTELGAPRADEAKPKGEVGPEQARPPRRFYATVDLDPIRPGPLVSQIAQSILVELQRSKGAKVKVQLDIEAENPEGYTDDVISVVRDNAATLRLNASFEEE